MRERRASAAVQRARALHIEDKIAREGADLGITRQGEGTERSRVGSGRVASTPAVHSRCVTGLRTNGMKVGTLPTQGLESFFFNVLNRAGRRGIDG